VQERVERPLTGDVDGRDRDLDWELHPVPAPCRQLQTLIDHRPRAGVQKPVDPGPVGPLELGRDDQLMQRAANRLLA
jgi:hypothetical protein